MSCSSGFCNNYPTLSSHLHIALRKIQSDKIDKLSPAQLDFLYLNIAIQFNWRDFI